MPEIHCPIWDLPLPDGFRDLGDSLQFYSPRAGGLYRIGQDWADTVRDDLESTGHTQIGQFAQASPREKANLSYWIYRQNLAAGILVPVAPSKARRSATLDAFKEAGGGRVPLLSHARLAEVYNRTPPAEERLLFLMKELLLQKDIPLPNEESSKNSVGEEYLEYQKAASASLNEDMEEFRKAIVLRQWAKSDYSYGVVWTNMARSLTLDARIWVEKQIRERSPGFQGFVAMSFQPDLDSVYENGFKEGIFRAGFEAIRIDFDTNHSEKIDDRIMAAIRQSRFVVADFTYKKIKAKEGKKYLGNGGVYYEAGFARGLGIPVIYTCRNDFLKHLHFDTNHIFHLGWEDAEELASKLRSHIEANFGHGPVSGHSF